MADYIGTTLSLIVIAVAIIIGLVVFANISGSIDTSVLNPVENETSALNQTFENVVTNTNTGFKLLAVGLIVVAAGVILAILLGFGGAGGAQ